MSKHNDAIAKLSDHERALLELGRATLNEAEVALDMHELGRGHPMGIQQAKNIVKFFRRLKRKD